MGAGHLMRGISLASALRDLGVDVRFICQNLPGNMSAVAERAGFKVALIPVISRWQQETDVSETEKCLPDGCDWAVVDHYSLDELWETRLRSRVRAILAIDDLGDRQHDCDVLVDQNFHPDATNRYLRRISPSTLTLLGPKHALLRPEYQSRRQECSVRRSIAKILVAFGGADENDQTSTTVAAIAGLNIPIDVVIGSAYQHSDRLRRVSDQHHHIAVHRNVSGVAGLMATADLAIGAGGGMTWERCCLYLPAIVVSIAANQEPSMQAMREAGLVDYLGRAEDVDAHKIRDAVQCLIDHPETLSSMSRRSGELVDGLGAARVAHVMRGQSAKDVCRSEQGVPTR
jgi:UDP-2,4-diacetamido-2,4,6-trideoxy-beta-L-altropyranose hydrolase